MSAGKRRRRGAPWHRVTPGRHRTGARNPYRAALAAGAVFFVVVVIAAGWARRSGISPAPPQQGPPKPGTLAELLAVPAAQLERIDIALINVLCAEGLPGAGGLDPRGILSTLDAWARRVDSETARHFYRFQRNPSEFSNSEGYFRALMLVVVTQEDFGVRYNPARIADPASPEPNDVFFADSRDLFLHGIASPRAMGTCISMPVFYAAIGRRLGYPIRLALAKNHLFARWEGRAQGDRFNIETTSRGLSTPGDDHYATWPYPMTDQEVRSGRYLRSLAPAEEFSVFLQTRGHCLRAAGRTGEAMAAYRQARSRAPNWPEHDLFLAAAARSAAPIGAPLQAQPDRGDDPFLAHADASGRRDRQIMEMGRGTGLATPDELLPPPVPPSLPPRPETAEP